MIVPYIFTALLVTPAGAQKVWHVFPEGFEACYAFKSSIPQMDAVKTGSVRFLEPSCDPQGIRIWTRRKS